MKFSRFAAVGIAALLLGQLTLILGVQVAHLPPPLAYFLQAVVAIEGNYLGNCAWTWRQNPAWPTWRRFHLARLVTVPLNQLLFALLVWRGVPYLIASLGLVALFTVVNYVMGDRLVWVRD